MNEIKETVISAKLFYNKILAVFGASFKDFLTNILKVYAKNDHLQSIVIKTSDNLF